MLRPLKDILSGSSRCSVSLRPERVTRTGLSARILPPEPFCLRCVRSCDGR